MSRLRSPCDDEPVPATSMRACQATPCLCEPFHLRPSLPRPTIAGLGNPCRALSRYRALRILDMPWRRSPRQDTSRLPILDDPCDGVPGDARARRACLDASRPTAPLLASRRDACQGSAGRAGQRQAMAPMPAVRRVTGGHASRWSPLWLYLLIQV